MLETIRLQLDKDQLLVLDTVLDFYRKQGKPIPSSILFHRHPKSVVEGAIARMGEKLIFQCLDNGRTCYQATFAAFFVSSCADDISDTFIRYLEYTRKRFADNPECEQITSDEIAEALQLESTTLLDLYHLISAINAPLGSCLGGRGFDGRWQVRLTESAGDLLEATDLHHFLEKRLIGQLQLPSSLEGRLFQFVKDKSLKALLLSDWSEAQRVYQANAWKCCVILCGGIIEAILIEALSRKEHEALARYSSIGKRRQSIDRWDLRDLVDIADYLGMLPQGGVHLSHAVREFRNLVHPGKLLRENLVVTEEEADVAMGAVRVIIRHFENTTESL